MTLGKTIMSAVSLFAVATFATITAASAQQPAQSSSPAAKPAKAKPTVTKKKRAVTKKVETKKREAKKPAAKPKAGRNSRPASGSSEPTLIGQYGDWGAYTAAPGGKKVCFALSKPKSMKASKEGIKRDQAYIFISTRPTDKVRDEVSIILGYPLSGKTDTTASVGAASFSMLTQNDGAWIKNAAEEPQLIEAIRKGSDLVVKGTSSRGTHTTDTYSLKGVATALDRVAKECGGNT